MRCVIQRVREAWVEVDGRETGRIDRGLLLLLGFARGDTARDAELLAEKVAQQRVFDDGERGFHLSVAEAGGRILLVSQFTLLGDCRRGRRASFDDALPSAEAKPLYDRFAGRLNEMGLQPEEGVFGASMLVHLVNDGPVTFLLDSRKAF